MLIFSSHAYIFIFTFDHYFVLYMYLYLSKLNCNKKEALTMFNLEHILNLCMTQMLQVGVLCRMVL